VQLLLDVVDHDELLIGLVLEVAAKLKVGGQVAIRFEGLLQLLRCQVLRRCEVTLTSADIARQSANERETINLIVTQHGVHLIFIVSISLSGRLPNPQQCSS
jgi:hypothetical protein